MSTGRNDPCPCGSGKKYKRCCMARDRQREHALRLVGDDHPAPAPDLAGAAMGGTWQAGIIPLAVHFDNDPSARPVLALVVGDDLVLHADVISHPPPELAEIAGLIETAVRAAGDATRTTPSMVEVRFAGVAHSLAERLQPDGIVVREARELASLEAAATGVAAHMTHRDTEPGPATSTPELWAGWGLPREQIARMFAATATYYRAAPWRLLANEQILQADMPDGATWTATVLGNGGQEFGLALYAAADELHTLLRGTAGSDALSLARSPVLSLLFADRDIVPRPMQREIRKAGWDVAGPSAYPLFWALNTPGGGVTGAQMDELIMVLGAIPRFVDTYHGALAGDEPVALPLQWRDPDTGTVLHYEGFALQERGVLWGVPAALTPAGPEGAGAAPEAALDARDDDDELDAFAEHERRVVDDFFAWLESGGTRQVSAATATKHARAAALFVDFLTGYQGIALRAVTEYDLRVFLYDWYPRKMGASRTEARALPGSLRRFFDYLAEREGVICPWARTMLGDTDVYMTRWESFPGGFFWDPGVRQWQTELYANLDARVMIHSRAAANGIEWGETMGPEQAQLEDELQRRWLHWRDEAIRAGITAPEAVRAAILPRQREWERTPNSLAGGATPADAVVRERAELDAVHADVVEGEDDIAGAMDKAFEALATAPIPDDIVAMLAETLAGRSGARAATTSRAKTSRRPTKRPRSGARKAGRIPASGASSTLSYQLHVCLDESRPLIWRRVRVPGAVSLSKLHAIIQAAMGWEGGHLYLFGVGQHSYGDPDPEWPDVKDARKTQLHQLAIPPGGVLHYTYDLGDNWQHDVLVESVESPEPDAPAIVCLAGQRACPPEDCGGVRGYERLLSALRDPDHPEHAELLEWVGGELDPDVFDLGAVNAVLEELS